METARTVSFFSSIRGRLLIMFLIIGLLPLLIATIISAVSAQNIITAEVQQQLATTSRLKYVELSQWLDGERGSIDFISTRNVVRGDGTAENDRGLPVFAQTYTDPQGDAYQFALDQAQRQIAPFVSEDALDVVLLDTEGVVVYSYLGTIPLGTDLSTTAWYGQPASDVFVDETLNQPVMVMAEPVGFDDSDSMGTAVVFLDATKLNTIFIDRSGLAEKETFETYLVNSDGLMLTESRFIEGAALNQRVDNTEGFRAAQSFEDAQTSAIAQPYTDYRGNTVLGAVTHLEDLGWTLISEVDQAEALAEQTELLNLQIAVLVVAVGVVALLAMQVARQIVRPINTLMSSANAIAAGDMSQTVTLNDSSEIGVLAQTFNKMAAQLKEVFTSMENRIAARTADLETSAEIAAAANQVREMDDLISMTVNLVRDRFNFYYVQVYLTDPDNQWAVLKDGTGYVGRRLLVNEHRLPLDGHSLVARAINSGEVVIVQDTSTDPDFLPNELLPETKAEITIPLRTKNAVIGALDIQHSVTNAFDDSARQLFTTLAEQLAVTFENVQLFEDTERRARELETVADVSIEASTNLNVSELLEAVVNLTRDNFGLYHAHMYLLDAAGETLVLSAGASEIGRQMVAEGHSIPLNRETSLVARAARSRSAVIVNDVTQAPDFQPNKYLPNTRSEMAVPMVVGDTLVGVLDVQSDTLNRFTEEDVRVKTTLALQVAVAIQNARSFERSNKQARDLAIVTDVGTQTVSTLDPEKLLQDITEYVFKGFDLYHAHIFLMDETGENLRIAGGAGPHGCKHVGAGYSVNIHEVDTPITRAARTREGQINNDVLANPNYAADPNLPDLRAEMAIPMVVAGELLGVLEVHSTEVNRFTELDIQIKTILAGQLGVALRNAYLFHETQNSQAFMSTVINATPDLIYVKDRNFRYTLANEGYAQITGRPVDEVIGYDDIELGFSEELVFGNEEKGIHGFRADDMHVLTTGETLHNPYNVIRDRQGQEYILDTYKIPMRDSDGNITGVLAFSRDVTLLHEAQELIAKRAAELQTVAEVSAAAATNLNVDELLWAVSNLTKDSFNLYHAHIYLLDDAGENLMLAAGAGDAGRQMVEKGHSIPIDREQSLVATAARTREGVVVNDVTQADGFMANPLLPDTRSEMAIPMVAGNTLIGVLDVQANITDRFTDEDVSVKTTLASQIAIAVQNARSFEQTQAAAVEMDQQNRLMDAILTNIPSGIFVVEAPSATPILSNKRAEELLGRGISPEANEEYLAEVYQAYIEGTDELYPAEKQPIVRGLYGEVSYVDDMEVRRPDGTNTLLEISGAPIKDAEDKVVASVVSFQDITERKALEQERIERSAQLNEALEVAHMAYWEFDFATGNFTFNDNFYAMLGTTAEAEGGYEMSAEHYSTKYVHPEDAPIVGANVQAAYETDDPNFAIELEARNIRTDGSIMYVTVRLQAVKDESGQTVRMIGANQDITESKQQAELIAKRAAELQTVAEVSAAAATNLNVDELLWSVSDLTKDSFNLYHAHIYLLDDAGENLMLVAGAGDAGRQMVEKGHSIPIDREQSLVATAARTREGVVVNDVTQADGFMANPLLPDTRSEMAIPMVAGDTLIGVLDVQANIVDRFTDEDVSVKTTLASQIAIAVQNARSHQETAEQAQAMAMLNELSMAITNATDEADIYRITANKIRDIFGGIRASITQMGADGKLEVFALDGSTGAMPQGMKLPVEGTAVGYCVMQREIVVIPNAEASEYMEVKKLAQQGVRSTMSAPLFAGNQVIGTLNVASPNENAFGDIEANLLQQAASLLAGAIENRRLFQQTEQALTQTEVLYQAGQQIASAGNTHEILQALVNAVPDYIDTVNINLFDDPITGDEQMGVIETVASWRTNGDESLNGFRHTPAEFPVVEWIVREDFVVSDVTQDERIDDFSRQGLLNLGLNAFVGSIMKAGTRQVGFILYATAQQYTFSDEDARFLRALTDQAVTAIESLRQFEQTRTALHNLDRVYSTSIDMIGTANVEGYFTQLNPAWEHTLGHSREELMAQPFLSFVHPDDIEMTMAEAAKVNEGVDVLNFENRYRCKDGSYKWVSWRSRVDLETGSIHFVARDVTDDKAIELERIERNAQLADALNTARLAYWEFDFATGNFIFNDEFYRLIGTTVEAEGGYEMGAEEYAQRFVHPDEQGVVNYYIQQAVASEDPNYSADFVTRSVRTSGEVTFDRVKFRVEKDAEGNPIRMIGANQDITENRRQEEALSRERALLRNLIDSVPDLIFYKDVNGVYLGCNTAFAAFASTTEADLIGKTDFDMFPAAVAEDFREQDSRMMEQRESRHNEEWVDYPDGRRVLLDTLKTPFVTNDGEVLGLIGISRDITERKLAAEELDRQNRLMDTILNNIPSGIFVVEAPSGMPVLANQRATELLGKGIDPDATQDELAEVYAAYKLGTDEIYPTEELPIVRGILGESVAIDDMEVRRPDGKRMLLEVAGAPIKDAEGAVVASVISFQDITERKAQEEALRQANQVIENSPTILFRWQAGDWAVQLVTENVRVFGYTAQEFLSGETAYASIIHPDDLERVVQEVTEYTQAGVESFTQEYRILTKDGEVRWTDDRTTIIRDAEGNALFYEGVVIDISERRAAEVEIRRQSAILENSRDFISMTDLEGNVIYLNPGGRDMVGMERDASMDGIVIASFHRPADLERIQNDGIPVAFEQGLWRGENNIKTTDGRLIPVDQTIFVIRDSNGNPQNLATIMSDITERKAAEAQIQKRAAELQTVAEVSMEAATNLNVDDLLWSVSNLTKDAFDLYHAHIYLMDEDGDNLVLAAGAGNAGQVMVERGHSIPLERKDSLVARAARTEGGVVVNDVTKAPDFLPNPLLPDTRSEMAIPMIASGTVVGVLDVQSEIPDRFTEEDVQVKTTLATQIAIAIQNARAYAYEQDTAERLRDLDRMKSEFLANMSHELRTPLNSIIGYSEIMLDGIDGDLTEDAIEDVKAIHGSGQHLLNIINDILDLAKIEAGRMQMDRQEVNMVAFAREIMHAGEILVKDKPVDLVVEAETDELSIYADPVRLRQIIWNIMSNAVKFTEQGSVTLAMGVCDDQPEMAFVRIADTGIGMNKEDLPEIFDQFRQVDGSSTRRAGGTGLGLNITQHLVHMHEGEITVDSELGVGTTFVVTFPLYDEAKVQANS